MFLSLIFEGFVFVYEERIMNYVEVDPRRLIAAEGIFGTITTTILLFVTANIPCYSEEMCDIGISFDSPSAAMIQIFRSFPLLFFTLLSVFSIMVFNMTGLYLTKYVSSIFRVIVDSMRTISVWFFSVLFGFEKLQLGSFVIRVIGFTLLIVGNLIYNEIIVIKYLEFDKFIGQKKPNSDPELLVEEVKELM